jgi:hypothetical protein
LVVQLNHKQIHPQLIFAIRKRFCHSTLQM